MAEQFWLTKAIASDSGRLARAGNPICAGTVQALWLAPVQETVRWAGLKCCRVRYGGGAGAWSRSDRSSLRHLRRALRFARWLGFGMLFQGRFIDGGANCGAVRRGLPG